MAVMSLRDTKGIAPKGSVRIDRKSRWGNPFKMSSEAQRAAVIASYREWLWGQIQSGKVTLENLATLHDKDLYCWCAPKACHGHVLAEAAKWAHGRLNGLTDAVAPEGWAA